MIRDGYLKRRKKINLINIILIALIIAMAVFSLVYGDKVYSLDTVFRVIIGENIQGASFSVGRLRLPRMLIGIMAGASFGIAGNTFQTMLRNPLASPDIIGISSGCSVSAVFCILVLHISGGIVSIISVVFGLLISLIIYMLSRGTGFSGGRLILIGIGVQAITNAMVSYMILKSTQYNVPSALRWLSGSLNGMSMKDVPIILSVLVIFGGISIVLTKYIQILELGDELATTLGININILRVVLIVCSVVLIAFATAITGPIAFVSLLAGPIAIKLTGSSSANAFSAALVGAILVLAGDIIAQFAFTTRFPVGVITGMIGAPYMLILLIYANKRGEI